MRLSCVIISTALLSSFAWKYEEPVTVAFFDPAVAVNGIPTMLDAERQVAEFISTGQALIDSLTVVYAANEEKSFECQRHCFGNVQIEAEKWLADQFQMIQYTQQSLEKELKQLNSRLYEPIEINLRNAVESVVARHGIDYMFEKSELLYADPVSGLDLTTEVRLELIRLEKERTGLE